MYDRNVCVAYKLTALRYMTRWLTGYVKPSTEEYQSTLCHRYLLPVCCGIEYVSVHVHSECDHK